MLKEMNSPKEFCSHFGIPLQTFYRWRTEGHGPAVYKLGGRLRISKTDAEDWAEAQREVEGQPQRSETVSATREQQLKAEGGVVA